MSELREKCRDRWPSLLTMMGIDRRYLTGQHGPCPICMQGRDRFRFDNKDGLGTFICSVCGAGDGFNLLEKVKGWDFKTCAQELESIVGKAEITQRRQQKSQQSLRNAMNHLWNGSVLVSAGDPVALYLAGRAIHLEAFPKALRYAERCSYHEGKNRYRHFPAMIAKVTAPDGTPTTIHRTYLDTFGRKAALDDCRRVMPGKIAKGSAIRLFDAAPRMGIAEGIETALSASIIWRMPVWAGLNAGMVMAWEPPVVAEEIFIFGDHDGNYAGQSAAFGLAHRLASQGKQISVELPDEPGDWNDALQTQMRAEVA